jgi:hypothetical protein
MKSFQVSTDSSGTRRIVKVTVYDDVKHLQRDAAAWDKKRGHDPSDYTRTHGICHKFERILMEDDKPDESQPYVAYMRLVKGESRTEIITHESTHAGLWIYQLDHKLESLDEIENEERLSYIIGELTSRIVAKMYEYDLF